MGWMYKQTLINLSPYDITSYIDSNFAGNSKDQKLIIEYYFFFNGVIVL